MVPIGEGRTKRFIHVGMRGISDIIGIRKSDGKFIAMEVKTPKRRNQVTQHQQHFMDRIQDSGGISGVVTSIEEADALLK